MSANNNQASSFNHKKYRAFAPIQKTDRRWPNLVIDHAPDWCSVDLRDGNQALIEPMSPTQKLEMFKLLVDVGFKEIEVGFPAASAPDFDFVRQLIEENHIPDDVTIQVLTQAREPLIARSFEALKGAKKAIVHLYNSTSTVQREQVFKKSRDEIKGIAIQGAEWVKEMAEQQPETQWSFQYSPESFTGTEMDYALEVCDAVINVWQPTPDNKVIINLPATVEVSTPNVYADQIEWINDNISHRDSVRISLHTHNDRGCGVAAAELGVLAGADRIEGTLLGNGERTGNMDIVTMAMNIYSQGIDPELVLSDMDRIISTVERCTQLAVHPRHAYAGELVFAAFSGSHQDAINKCMSIDAEKRKDDPNAHWEVAYLPIDPRDLGRSYQQVIRINSQSGKGGVAYVLEQDYGIQMPRWMQVDFSPHIQAFAEQSEAEVGPTAIHEIFSNTYLNPVHAVTIDSYQLSREGSVDTLEAKVQAQDQHIELSGKGKGVLDAFVKGLSAAIGHDIVLLDYNEHALPSKLGAENEQAEAMAYVQISIQGQRYCAASHCDDIVTASMQALLNALSRSDVSVAKTAAISA
ncbi:2-isopropylmalate synthase [Psychromonas sp. 14N.309.X.WAT.B.A12]|uniref:2-isopropylmalate synthase n=1 Tax=Psychromonas sp. 14N.309.X.WAT.B.A12 TaxID=2998322 RepID=UPI0025AFEED5|nr:2-isopropylmalate synthase [Psychromonas sp. 14N.309.X.WAT.B.A12]MDN2663324.1 2-isopropylmalate synthase [Psychromonas sp. 14N.309.X.WAT.B.A12]